MRHKIFKTIHKLTKKLIKPFRALFILLLITGLVFSGWLWKIPEAQAAISFVGSAENSSVGNTDTTVDISALGLQAGDLVIVTAGIGDDDSLNHDVLINSADYTEIADLFADDTDDTNLAVWWKIMGSTPDPSVVVEGSTGGTDSSIAVVVMAFRGVDQATPMDVTPTTVTGLDTFSPNPPSINHNNPSGVWTVIAGASGHILGGAGTYTFPTGYTTTPIDRGSDDTNDITVGMGYRSSGVSDPEDPGVMTHSGTLATTNSWAAVTMALRPALIVVDTPVYDNGTATYNNDVSVTITVTNPTSSTICYTTNGDTPVAITPGTCSTGTTYSVPVSITATGTVLKAIGTKAGYTNSAVQSATYTLQVANPSFGTNGGSFNNDTTSTQTSTTTSAVFCQTVDGVTNPEASTPGTCSVGTTGPDATVIATGKTIKVLGTKANYVNSAVQTSNTFTLTVGAITSIPGAGTYSSTQSVTLSIATTTSAVAHYTTDGNPVSCSSTTYTGAFDVSVTTTVKAIGCKTNYVDDTAISDLYTIGPSTAIEIVGKLADTAITTITFPEGAPNASVSVPFNNVDTVSDAQVLDGAGASEPVVRLKNTSGGTLTVTLEITTWSEGVAASEVYELVVTTDTNIDEVDNVLSTDGNAASVPTGISITAGAYKALYLKLVLSSVAAKTGNSTLTILGEG